MINVFQLLQGHSWTASSISVRFILFRVDNTDFTDLMEHEQALLV